MAADEPRFPPGWPEDYKEYVKRNMEEQQLQFMAHQHNMMGFFETLDKDQLNTLAAILHNITHNGANVTFYQGFILARLELIHGQCSACGENHAEDIAKFHAEMVADAEATTLPPDEGPIAL